MDLTFEAAKLLTLIASQADMDIAARNGVASLFHSDDPDDRRLATLLTDSSELLALAAADEDERVRAAAASRCAMPDRFLDDESSVVRAELANRGYFLDVLVDDPDPWVCAKASDVASVVYGGLRRWMEDYPERRALEGNFAQRVCQQAHRMDFDADILIDDADETLTIEIGIPTESNYLDFEYRLGPVAYPLTAESARELSIDLYREYEDFDIDEHVRFAVEHGDLRSIRTILEDVEEADNALRDLDDCVTELYRLELQRRVDAPER